MQCKFLVIGIDEETKEYINPDIVYSDSDVDDYNQNVDLNERSISGETITVNRI